MIFYIGIFIELYLEVLKRLNNDVPSDELWDVYVD